MINGFIKFKKVATQRESIKSTFLNKNFNQGSNGFDTDDKKTILNIVCTYSLQGGY